MNANERRINHDFVLNLPRYADGSILLARREFRLRFEPRACHLGAQGVRLPVRRSRGVSRTSSSTNAH